MNTQKQKILITGGAGFIGSHLAKKLIADKNAITVIDNLSTGSLNNLTTLKNSPDFYFVHDTILNKKVMRALVENCDVIYHLAAAVGVRLIVEDPVHTIETNIHGTEVVLHFANEFRKPVFIASTSEVYGKNNEVPFREDDDTVLGATIYPRWSYAASKSIDEFLALAYHKQFGLDVVVARFFNTIGPSQTGQYGMVVPRFIEAALENKPLQIYGSGKQSRCFSFVDDVVEASIALMKTADSTGRVFNIGSTEEISIEDLADLIIKLSDSKSRKEYISYEKAYGPAFDDMMRRVPAVEKLEKTIGFKPDTNLENALRKIIDAVKADKQI